MIKNDDGYEVPKSYDITTETVGDAEVQNYLGTRLINDGNVASYEN